MYKNYAGRRLDNGDTIVEVHEGEITRELKIGPGIRGQNVTGFEWGSAGIGAAQLALTILADFTGKAPDVSQYQLFKHKFIQGIQDDRWLITGNQIQEFLNAFNINGNPDAFL